MSWSPSPMAFPMKKPEAQLTENGITARIVPKPRKIVWAACASSEIVIEKKYNKSVTHQDGTLKSKEASPSLI